MQPQQDSLADEDSYYTWWPQLGQRLRAYAPFLQSRIWWTFILHNKQPSEARDRTVAFTSEYHARLWERLIHDLTVVYATEASTHAIVTSTSAASTTTSLRVRCALEYCLSRVVSDFLFYYRLGAIEAIILSLFLEELRHVLSNTRVGTTHCTTSEWETMWDMVVTPQYVDYPASQLLSYGNVSYVL